MFQVDVVVVYHHRVFICPVHLWSPSWRRTILKCKEHLADLPAEMRVQDRKSNSFYIELSPANVDQSKQCCYSANERPHMLQTFSQSGTVIEEVTWIKKSGTNRGKLERIHLYIFSYYGRVPWSTSQYHGLRVPVGQSLVPRTWMMSTGALWCFFKRVLPFFGNNPCSSLILCWERNSKLSKTSWKTPERSQWRSLSGLKKNKYLAMTASYHLVNYPPAN